MKKKVVEIDFKKSKNRVILLVGDNGTGKTSLLSALHPFAYPGNMDVRDTGELILDEVDGYKEVHLEDDGTLYVIKHHYLYTKNGRNVKSYISKDGTEMNPNGNVTSFKEIILSELSLEIDFLKLIRLGSNVTNFIDMKASERKSFTSELLSEVDVYSKLYKKINEDSRVLKTMMKSVTDKLEKLKILDEKDVIIVIELLEDKLTSLKEEKDSYNSQIWSINGSIGTLIPEGVESFLYSIRTDEESYNDMVREIKTKQNKIDKIPMIIMGSIEESISSVMTEITNNENKIAMNTNMINFYFTQLNNLYTQKEERENNLKYITSDLEYTKLNDLYLGLHREKEKLDKHYKNYEPKCSKDDMLSALRLMQEIEQFVSNIHTFNHNAVTNVVNHMLNDEDVNDNVRREISSIDDKIQKNNFELMKLNNIVGKKDGVYVLFKPTDCKSSNCPYVKFYDDHVDAKKDSPVEKLTAEIKKLENKREFFESMYDINKNIDYILLLIKSNNKLIEKLPEDFFSIKRILNSIKDCIPFFDEDNITNYIAVLEEYEHYLSIKEKIKDIKKELSFIEKNATSLATMQKELDVLDNDIYKLNNDINSLKKVNEMLSVRNDKLSDLREVYEDYKDGLDEIKDLSDKASKLFDSLVERRKIQKKIDEYIVIKKDYERKISVLDVQIKQVDEEITNNKFKLREFEALKEEKAIIEEQFDDIDTIKEALSSNKGMPLLFIQLYLRKTKAIVNELLSELFGGELEIDDFDINDREFKIPYIKNGIRVSDIISCSQGERSFISLAISFALVKQSIERYNIMLLDEIDSTLDMTNRPIFIKILEEQLKAIGSEQVFLITHNNMFDNYPVDLIMTSDIEIDNYKNTNVIFRAA